MPSNAVFSLDEIPRGFVPVFRKILSHNRIKSALLLEFYHEIRYNTIQRSKKYDKGVSS